MAFKRHKLSVQGGGDPIFAIRVLLHRLTALRAACGIFTDPSSPPATAADKFDAMRHGFRFGKEKFLENLQRHINNCDGAQSIQALPQGNISKNDNFQIHIVLPDSTSATGPKKRIPDAVGLFVRQTLFE